MKKNIIFTLAFSLQSLVAFGQSGNVGVNTATPNSTLSVAGSFQAGYKEITSSTYTLTRLDHYITYNGTNASTFTLPVIGTGSTSFTGRIYKIKNLSAFPVTLQASGGNTLRADTTAGVSAYTLSPGSYLEIVNNANANGGTWDLFSTNKNNVETYASLIRIPRHADTDWIDHTNTAYDTSASGSDGGWFVISKKSYSYTHTADSHRTSRETVVYEYQGAPFNLNNLYPLITTGNGSSFTDIFTASIISLQNNGTGGRTRLTLSIARLDFVGDEYGSQNSNWQGSGFFVNLLLARRTN